jgi:hypothetical protein
VLDDERTLILVLKGDGFDLERSRTEVNKWKTLIGDHVRAFAPSSSIKS